MANDMGCGYIKLGLSNVEANNWADDNATSVVASGQRSYGTLVFVIHLALHCFIFQCTK